MPQPVAHSPLADMHRRQAATLQLRDGWMVATRYPQEPKAAENTIVDLAHRPTWEISGPEVGRKLAELCGSDIAIRQIHCGAGWEAYRLTAGRAILFGKTPRPMTGELDVTGGWVTLALIGPDVEKILNKVTAVDLRERTL